MERALELGSTASNRNDEMVLGDFADLKVRSAQQTFDRAYHVH